MFTGLVKCQLGVVKRQLGVIAFVGLVATACASSPSSPSVSGTIRDPLVIPVGQIRDFGPPPEFATGPLGAELDQALEMVFGEPLGRNEFGPDQVAALGIMASSGDARVAWPVIDLLRFVRSPDLAESLAGTAGELLGVEVTGVSAWGELTDRLIAWDVPAPPDYLDRKRNIFGLVLPQWAELMVPGEIDWRHVSWGGVGIDDRPSDRTDDRCNCIPAADNPPVDRADEADWLDAETVVFGVAIGGEFRAYPRRIMEVREMVNDTLGGRDLAMPYCTLCGSAQVYLTDEVPTDVSRPILRTSGLLIRSNKVMYDLESLTVFDTFTGRAVAGPLAERAIVLPQVSVVTTTWGEWSSAHPETTVLVEELALGRDFDFRNNRDVDGPIFPIGQTDTRLGVHADIVGVIAADGPIAFWVEGARDALDRGRDVELAGVRLIEDGGGLRAVGADGEEIASHQAFWFAWSQFHPDTELWLP